MFNNYELYTITITSPDSPTVIDKCWGKADQIDAICAERIRINFGQFGKSATCSYTIE